MPPTGKRNENGNENGNENENGSGSVSVSGSWSGNENGNGKGSWRSENGGIGTTGRGQFTSERLCRKPPASFSSPPAASTVQTVALSTWGATEDGVAVAPGRDQRRPAAVQDHSAMRSGEFADDPSLRYLLYK